MIVSDPAYLDWLHAVVNVGCSAPEAMVKEKSCRHQFASEPCCVPPVVNAYRCEACDASWTDEWSCGCSDECPQCGELASPEDSTEIEGEPCACAYLSDPADGAA